MGNQGLLLMDLNHEIGGLNRRPEESALEYWNRLHADADFINAKKDYCFPEFQQQVMQQRNATHKVSDHTYYFSISSGDKKINFGETPEIFKEPK